MAIPFLDQINVNCHFIANINFGISLVYHHNRARRPVTETNKLKKKNYLKTKILTLPNSKIGSCNLY